MQISKEQRKHLTFNPLCRVCFKSGQHRPPVMTIIDDVSLAVHSVCALHGRDDDDVDDRDCAVMKRYRHNDK
jgi:hypothetical protein